MRVAALSLAALLTTACATFLPTPEASFTPAPLSARWSGLSLSGRDLRFSLSHPAYAAIFDITPGAGAGLIYPGTFDRQYQRAGLIMPIMPRYVPAFSGYLQSTVASYYAGPRMLLLVASRSPLRLQGLYTAGGMRRLIGNLQFASYFPQQTLEHVLHGVLPMQADADWDADVLVIWPDDPPLRFVRQYRVLVCDDRTTLVVPITYVGGCPRDQSVVASAPSSGGVGRPPRDTEREAPAGQRPRTPRPADERDAGGRVGRTASEGRSDVDRESRTRRGDEQRAEPRSSEPRSSEPRSSEPRTPQREPDRPREPVRETAPPRNVDRPSTPHAPAPR
jgi:hypothetical protein